MISTTDFKRGSTKILWNEEPWLVVEFQHVKPGKGGAFVRTKMRNLISQRMLEETFRSGEKFPPADLEYSKVQYLYEDDLYQFMDQESFEQMGFTKEQLGNAAKYLQDGAIYNVIYFRNEPITIEPPMFMELLIAETVPGVKGNTAQGGSKPATLETGITIQVPLFLNEGEKVKVDTRQDVYIERV